ncbi:hypothetical protein BCR32DRAFT_292615 [Anaeromyces robustus]|uniref:CBM10 domain-containing protein n=1 Tax=Anaeromyces robustus TaxID=1754192 RepID=A0A1Y1XAR9_9FUNG|nr:hypothetical protein BCR32DRAFT_292615 [Anaeromyces robustus]|eukprot:ORX82454.1 hypothetical protein BCR32DRAFT_292615 [Anaeromyces robustus]
MLTFQLILVLFFVWQINASSFLENTKRAKFFELSDNEVPVFRITLPENDIKQLKQELQVPSSSFEDVAEGLLNVAAGNGTDEEENKNKYKDGSLVIELAGEKKTFDKFTFSAGGSSARTYGRQGFNIKIRGNDDFYGRSQFRLRSDARDATFLRSKIACDMHNRLGLVSISANYAQLYVNDEYFGFYVLMDSPKLPWIKELFDDKDTKNLYKCKVGGNFLTEASCAERCENENEEVTDHSEWVEFLKALDNAKSAKDIEDIFEVDQFLYEAAYEFLTGAWDHLLHSGHNYSMYKQKNGKWVVIYYDFDGDMGQDIIGVEFGQVQPNPNKNYPTYTFKEWMMVPIHLLDILIFNDPTRFKNILKKFVTEVFNPATLYPHIDEIKEFIKPYIVKIRTPDENGKLPGVLNELNPVDYSLQEWDANSEFTTIFNHKVNGSAYGLKYWILAKYRNVCSTYQWDCDPIYMDENYDYPIDKDVEGEINIHAWDGIDFSGLFGPPTEGSQLAVGDPTKSEDSTKPTTNTSSKLNCIGEVAGYPCCSEGVNKVYEHDINGEWGYDFSKKQWCSLTPSKESVDDATCWSKDYGYPCCKSCFVFEETEEGKWGYEDNHWCGIQSFCN